MGRRPDAAGTGGQGPAAIQRGLRHRRDLEGLLPRHGQGPAAIQRGLRLHLEADLVRGGAGQGPAAIQRGLRPGLTSVIAKTDNGQGPAAIQRGLRPTAGGSGARAPHGQGPAAIQRGLRPHPKWSPHRRVPGQGPASIQRGLRLPLFVRAIGAVEWPRTCRDSARIKTGSSCLHWRRSRRPRTCRDSARIKTTSGQAALELTDGQGPAAIQRGLRRHPATCRDQLRPGQGPAAIQRGLRHRANLGSRHGQGPAAIHRVHAGPANPARERLAGGLAESMSRGRRARRVVLRVRLPLLAAHPQPERQQVVGRCRVVGLEVVALLLPHQDERSEQC